MPTRSPTSLTSGPLRATSRRAIPTGSSWRPTRAPERRGAQLSTPPARTDGDAETAAVSLARKIASVLAILTTAGLVCATAAAAPRHDGAPNSGIPKWRGAGKSQPHLRPGPPVPDVPGPLKIRDGQYAPVAWSDIAGWRQDDHAAAFATFRTSCRPIARAPRVPGESRPMYGALHAVCVRALRAGALDAEAARKFFEDNFRPVRISRVGEGAGFLTGYYEPIVDGSRFPTGTFHVPIYRRPPDLLPPAGASTAGGFPNTGQSLRRDASGALVPY